MYTVIEIQARFLMLSMFYSFIVTVLDKKEASPLQALDALYRELANDTDLTLLVEEPRLQGVGHRVWNTNKVRIKKRFAVQYLDSF